MKSQIVHWLIVILCSSLGSGVGEWLRHYATSREVSESVPSDVSGNFFRGSRRNHVPWSWVKAAGA